MRRILIDNARRKRALRHGGQLDRADIADVDLPLPMPTTNCSRSTPRWTG
jgi:hypothetical protein